MTTFTPGDRITGRSLLSNSTVTGRFRTHTGDHGEGAVIKLEDGTTDVVSTTGAEHVQFTIVELLRQFADHIEAGPELGDVDLSSVMPSRGELRVQLYQRDKSTIADTVAWANSVGAESVRASRVKEDWHLSANGKLSGGATIALVAVTRDAESRALDKAIGDSKLNDAIPLDVLAKHQRPKPDALTAEQIAELKHSAKTPMPGGDS
jgi:hypothetical protein